MSDERERPSREEMLEACVVYLCRIAGAVGNRSGEEVRRVADEALTYMLKNGLTAITAVEPAGHPERQK